MRYVSHHSFFQGFESSQVLGEQSGPKDDGLIPLEYLCFSCGERIANNILCEVYGWHVVAELVDGDSVSDSNVVDPVHGQVAFLQ